MHPSRSTGRKSIQIQHFKSSSLASHSAIHLIAQGYPDIHPRLDPVNLAYVIYSSSSAKNAPHDSACRTWLSWESLMSSSCCPSMPIPKVISRTSSSDFPLKSHPVHPDRRPPSFLGPLVLNSLAAISRGL